MVEYIERKFVYKYENHVDLFYPIEAISRGSRRGR